VAGPLNSKPKYVLAEGDDFGWGPVTALDLDGLRELKRTGDGELHLVGSAALARTVIGAGLADRLRLMIDPVLLGGGKSFLPAGGAVHAWRLVECVPTSTGALLVTYDAES
jgi:dihydrofolate reductase